MVTIKAPDWLVQREGELRNSANGSAVSVHFAGKLQYVVNLSPAGGKYGCRVVQTNNGKRLDKGAVHETPESALQGGLEELRAALGW